MSSRSRPTRPSFVTRTEEEAAGAAVLGRRRRRGYRAPRDSRRSTGRARGQARPLADGAARRGNRRRWN